MKKFYLLVLFCLIAAGRAVYAEDRVSEGDMFGSTSATPTPAAAEVKGPDLSSAKVSSGSVKEENLQIGGTLSDEADLYLQNGVPLDQNTATNPNILFLYLDSKLENDARVFARVRSYYDPTGLTGGNTNASSFTNPYGFGNGSSDNLSVSLQELRVSANIGHEVFFTIGRQKVKYGTAHFFNPTDFLNAQAFNFFLPTDERTGVDMIKAHLPVGTANFYAAGLAGNPTTGKQSGGYLRSEVAYDGVAGDLLGAGEFSLSGWFPKDQPGRLGFDLSQAVEDFDVYVEGAAGQNTAGSWEDALSSGFTWEVKYADRDTNTVTFEGEYFQAGALAEYGVFAVDLGGPWGLNDITFIETNLFNFIDQSGLSRLDTVCQFSDRISGRVYASAPWGTVGGSFYLPGEIAQTGVRMDVNF